MKKSFLSSKSFKVRTKVSIGIVLIVVIGTLMPYAVGLRIVYSVAAIISMLEVHMLMLAQKQLSWQDISHAMFAHAVLAFSIIAVIHMPSAILIIGIILTMTSDTSAYLIGKTCGTKFIHSHPFPIISPNKSWEGTIGGIVIPGLAIPILNYIFHEDLPIFVGCLAGLCAITGDLSESLFKRHHGVKDANDILKTKPGFRYVEALLGGSEGHGGYFDRLDSMSVVLLFMGIVTALSYSLQ